MARKAQSNEGFGGIASTLLTKSLSGLR